MRTVADGLALDDFHGETGLAVDWKTGLLGRLPVRIGSTSLGLRGLEVGMGVEAEQRLDLAGGAHDLVEFEFGDGLVGGTISERLCLERDVKRRLFPRNWRLITRAAIACR